MKMMRTLNLLMLLGLLFSSTEANALLVKSLTLRQMVERSEIIFRGTVLGATVEADPAESGLDVKYFRFRCEEVLKGECDGELILKQPLGLRDASVSYENGKSYLIFLSGASELGFSAPIGIGQGISEIVRQGSTDVLVNKILVQKLERAPAGDTKSLKTAGSSDDYQGFRQQIESLVKETQ